VSRWPVAGTSGYWLLASSPVSEEKQQCTQSITNRHKMTTVHTRQIQLTKFHIRKTTTRVGSTVYSFYIFSPIHIARMPLPQTTSHHFTTHIYPFNYAPLSPLPYTALHFPSLHFTSLHFR